MKLNGALRGERKWGLSFWKSLIGFCFFLFVFCPPVIAEPTSPFKSFPGRWVGDGRIGFKDGTADKVKCRVTYFLDETGQKLRQNLRCHSTSYSIEVKAKIVHDAGQIAGSWHETIYNVGGDVSGRVVRNGLTLFVKSQDLTAIMQIATIKNKQIVEIKFENIEMIGVSILLKKG